MQNKWEKESILERMRKASIAGWKNSIEVIVGNKRLLDAVDDIMRSVSENGNDYDKRGK